MGLRCQPDCSSLVDALTVVFSGVQGFDLQVEIAGQFDHVDHGAGQIDIAAFQDARRQQWSWRPPRRARRQSVRNRAVGSLRDDRVGRRIHQLDATDVRDCVRVSGPGWDHRAIVPSGSDACGGEGRYADRAVASPITCSPGGGLQQPGGIDVQVPAERV